MTHQGMNQNSGMDSVCRCVINTVLAYLARKHIVDLPPPSQGLNIIEAGIL